MNYTLFIKDLSLLLVIGLYPEERLEPQEILCDLEFDLKCEHVSDDIAHTLNYAELADHLVAAVATTQFKLVESLAAFILDEIFAFHDVKRAKVALVKSNALVIPKASGCGIVMERYGGDGQK